MVLQPQISVVLEVLKNELDTYIIMAIIFRYFLSVN